MADVVPFTRTRLGWFALLDGGLIALAVLSLHRPSYDAAVAVVPLPRRSALQRLLIGALGLHLAEGLYAARTARRESLPVGAWTVQTLVVGFPSTRGLRRTVAAVGPDPA